MNKRIKKKKQCVSFIKKNNLTNQDAVIMRFNSNVSINEILEYHSYMNDMLKIYNLDCPVLPEVKDKYCLFDISKTETLIYLQKQTEELKNTFTEEDWEQYNKMFCVDF